MELPSFRLRFHAFLWSFWILTDPLLDLSHNVLDALFSNLSLSSHLMKKQEVKNVIFFLWFKAVSLDVALLELVIIWRRQYFFEDRFDWFFHILGDIVSSTTFVDLSFFISIFCVHVLFHLLQIFHLNLSISNRSNCVWVFFYDEFRNVPQVPLIVLESESFFSFIMCLHIRWI